MIGIEWVNKYHGRASRLYKCDNSTRGFAERLDGILQFEWGNDDAWDVDFEEYGVGSPIEGQDRAYADLVDIAYFAGHGSGSGFLFGIDDYDDGEAKWSEMSLGERGLKWLIVDACETLHDPDGKHEVFKGLHSILGFNTICTDEGSRGRRFAERLNDGYTMIDAWLRACRETESWSKRFACMWANNADTDTMNDHWIGKGFVSRDPHTPTAFYYLNSPC